MAINFQLVDNGLIRFVLLIAPMLMVQLPVSTAQQSKKAIHFTPQLLFIDNNEACDIADINNDGLDDIVAGRNWYAAPDFVPRPLRPIASHPPDYASNNGEHVIDLDGDGWKDVITTGWGEKNIRWYKNPGATDLKKGIPWQGFDLAHVGHGDGEVGSLEDLDGDGRPEYIVNSYIKTLPLSVWLLETGATLAAKEVVIGPRSSHGIGFGDINGDGKKDIMIDDGWYEQPAQGAWSGSWTWHRDWNLGSASCQMQVVDLNNDGRNDFIAGNGHGYGLYWMEQGDPIGDSTTWTRHGIDETWSQVHTLAWVDLDNDGQKELLTGKRIKAHSGNDPGSDDPAFIYLYSWNEKLNTFDRQVIADGIVGTGLILRIRDLNGDNKPDIVAAGKTGTYILWQD